MRTTPQLTPIGRTATLNQIGDELSRSQGSCSAVLVEGPAGGGVSTLLTDAVAAFGARYARVITASAYGRGDYRLVIEAFGGTELADDLRAAVDPSAAPDPCRPAQLARCITAWARTVRLEHPTRATTGGVLVVLDDAQRCDAGSLAVLEALLRRSVPVALTFLIGARNGRVPAALRRTIDSGAGHARVLVAPWDVAEAQRHLPGVSSVRARALCAATDGRPGRMVALGTMSTIDVRQLDRLPVEAVADHAECAGTDLRPPEGMSDECRRTAAAAAVLGPRVVPERVAAITGRTTAEVTRCLLDLLEADLVMEESGRLKFAHPVSRAVVYRWVDASCRYELHRRAAELVSTGPGTTLLDAADHLAVCASAGDRRALEALLDAAARRLSHDPDAAARWAAAAHGLVQDPDGDDAVRATTLLALAHAACGRHASALDHAAWLMQPRRATSVATLITARSERALGRAAVARSLLRAELAGASNAEVELEVTATEILLGECSGTSGAHPDAENGASASTPSDDSCHAARAILRLARAVFAPTGREPLDDLIPLARHAAECVDRLPAAALSEIVTHLPQLVWSELRLGLSDQALLHAHRGLRVAAGRHDVVARLTTALAAAAAARGQLALALDRAEEAAELAGDLGLDDVRRLAEAVALPAAVATRGPSALLGRQLEVGAVRPGPQERLTVMAHIRALMMGGRHDTARDLLVRLRRPDVVIGADEAGVAAIACMLHLEERDLDAAARMAALAQRSALGGTLADRARADDATAALGAARGEWAPALAAARTSAAAFDQVGAPIDAACSRLRVGEALRGLGDVEGAQREIGLAKRILQVHGADHLVSLAVTAQKRIAASQSRGLGARSFGLSGRELEIAELVRRGLTNKTIAARLFLSVRTVDSHVAHVLAKVGVGSRIELVGLFGAEDNVA